MLNTLNHFLYTRPIYSKRLLFLSIYTTLSLSLFGQQADAARSSPLLDQNAAPSSNSSSGDPTKKTPPPAKVLDQDTGQHPENDDMLLKSMWGVRPWLAQYGITFTAVDVNEVWGNPYGGIKQGAAYEGMTTLTLNWDPEKVLGFKHGLFNISAMQIRGRSFT
ncbi:Carbohydrate-selective porin OprB (OprB) (PDB:4GEY), partial [Commensalibacter papalotli (ex Botero et al. 2024)]